MTKLDLERDCSTVLQRTSLTSAGMLLTWTVLCFLSYETRSQLRIHTNSVIFSKMACFFVPIVSNESPSAEEDLTYVWGRRACSQASFPCFLEDRAFEGLRDLEFSLLSPERIPACIERLDDDLITNNKLE